MGSFIMAPLRISHLLWLLPAVLAIPAPQITPAAVLSPREAAALGRRDLISDADSYVHSVLTGYGSQVESYIASGVPQFFQGLPTGTQVQSSLGIPDSDLAALPTQVLNVPAYANWTEGGWNVRVHGNVYKQPDVSQSKIDDLANIFLVDVDIKDLPADQQAQARNLTREIFVVQQRDVNVTVSFINDVTIRAETDSGAVNAEGGQQQIQLPYETTDEGDFDTFVVLYNTTGPNGGHMMGGNETDRIQTLNMYVNGTETGNATAYLVPPSGITVISDIDDILRVTKIYDPVEGLLNSFARPFVPWLNMPDIYANWSKTVPDMHYHYLTTTPEQVTRNYMDYIYKTYPLGSFDTRPLNFSDVSATLAIRKFLLDRIFQTFPTRKFILVGDTSNSDVMKDYPALATDYPGQVLCIFLRNTSSTDSADKFPYDTSGFEGLPQDQYMFFNVPDDLRGLDVVNGKCYNGTVRENVTFGYQGLPFGLGSDSSAGGGRVPGLWGVLGLGVVVGGVVMGL